MMKIYRVSVNPIYVKLHERLPIKFILWSRFAKIKYFFHIFNPKFQ